MGSLAVLVARLRSARWATLAVAIVAGLGAAAPAAARLPASGPAPTTTLRPVGSLTFLWAGDPARGCAAQGLCGVRGYLVVRVGDSSSGAPGLPPVELSDQAVTARVQERSASGASVSDCADLESVDFQLNLERSRGRVVRAASTQGALGWPSAGRCAGPTATDLSALVLPARRLGRRGFDLSGRRSFGAGPFEVTASSRLEALFQSSTFPFPPPTGPSGFRFPHGHPALTENVEVDYRIASAQGALGASFAGVGAPLCRSLGTCARTGTVSLVLGPGGHGPLAFFGTRMVRRHVTARRALRDLHAGRLSLQDSSSSLSFAGGLTGTLLAPGAPACASALREPVDALSSAVRGRVDRFVLGGDLGVFPALDYLRSRCPGPTTADIAGPGSLAAGSLPVSSLGARRLTLRLAGSGRFDAGGYVGSRQGSLTLRLIRTRIVAGTQRTTVFGSRA